MKTLSENLSTLEKEYEAKKAKLETKNAYAEKTGIAPSYVSNIYGKTLLSFNVDNLKDAETIKEYFKPQLINVPIRTAGDDYKTASPYYIQFKTWSFNGEQEAEIHFETEKEYIDIKVPFKSYDKDLLTGFSHNYEGEQAELRRMRRQPLTYNSAGLKGFDNMTFYGGSTKSYIKAYTNEEHLTKFEKILFTGNI